MTMQDMMDMAGATAAPATEQEEDELCLRCIRMWHKIVTERHRPAVPLEQMTI